MPFTHLLQYTQTSGWCGKTFLNNTSLSCYTRSAHHLIYKTDKTFTLWPSHHPIYFNAIHTSSAVRGGEPWRRRLNCSPAFPTWVLGFTNKLSGCKNRLPRNLHRYAPAQTRGVVKHIVWLCFTSSSLPPVIKDISKTVCRDLNDEKWNLLAQCTLVAIVWQRGGQDGCFPCQAEHLFLLSGCSVGLITPPASIRVLLPENCSLSSPSRCSLQPPSSTLTPSGQI